MGFIETTSAPFVKLTVAGSVEIGTGDLISFDWKSFMNGGYIIRVSIIDPYLNFLQSLFVIDDQLRDMRNHATPVTFQIGWVGDKGQKSDILLANLVDIRATGRSNGAVVEFIAIDPPSWWLNAGTGDGKVYKGKISSVINQVVQEFSRGNVEAEVSETNDNPENYWPMMRQDPKTFIKSLLEWSASGGSREHTGWITASDGDTKLSKPKIIIKEQHKLTPSNLGTYNVMGLDDNANDMLGFEFASDAFLTVFQTRLTTQGISAVSGQYIDQSTNEDVAAIRDENTDKKYNARTENFQSYQKPTDKWATSILAVPEFNGAEIGLKYKDYIGGRARSRFMAMLPYVMRLKVQCPGNAKLTSSTKLGVSYVTLIWAGARQDHYFLNGNWMVYGFHHNISNKKGWHTDMYLYRFDYNASAQRIP